MRMLNTGKNIGILFAFIVLGVLIVASVGAEEEIVDTQIVVNSQDWVDVYTGLLYGNLNGQGSYFLLGKRHAAALPNILDKSKLVTVIESGNFPYVTGYSSDLENRGFAVEQIKSENGRQLNLDIGRIVDTNSFIIIDDSYGYNAISVAPYAILTKSFVLFADKKNIDDIVDLLSEKEATNIIIYGFVDREVKEALEPYAPEIISSGNRFDDNIEIVKKFRSIYDNKQVHLTNGEFIEGGLMGQGQQPDPVLFIGKANVPSQVQNYLKSTDIRVGVLVGNDLVGSASAIKKSTGLNIIIKFAQSGYERTGAFQGVKALDMFPLPMYDLNISIEKVNYNKETRQLEIIFKNLGEQAVFIKSSAEIIVDETPTLKVGDEAPQFLDGEETRAMAFDIDLIDYIAQGKSITARVSVTFGESVQSMDHTFNDGYFIDLKESTDNSKIALKNVVYNKRIQRFMVTLENIGDVDAFADPTIVDLIVNDEKITISYDGVASIGAGKEKTLPIKQRLDDVDIMDNEQIKLRVYHGENEDLLLKSFEETIDLDVESGYTQTYIVIVVVILVSLVILAVYYYRTKGKRKRSASKVSAAASKKGGK